MTLSSELGYYKILYGPQVLLQMNIAYFLPSIPLLAISSLCDDWLDQHCGELGTWVWLPCRTWLGRLSQLTGPDAPCLQLLCHGQVVVCQASVNATTLQLAIPRLCNKWAAALVSKLGFVCSAASDVQAAFPALCTMGPCCKQRRQVEYSEACLPSSMLVQRSLLRPSACSSEEQHGSMLCRSLIVCRPAC